MENKKQSSVEWLYSKMYEHRGNITIEEFEQAKAMHKEEIENSYDYMRCIGSFTNGKEYYKEMYTSNASELGNSLEWNGEVTKGNNHIVDTNEMIDHIGDANKMVKEDSLHFPTSDVNQVPDVRKMVEISDEEIEDVAWEKFITNSGRFGFIAGAKWMRDKIGGQE